MPGSDASIDSGDNARGRYWQTNDDTRRFRLFTFLNSFSFFFFVWAVALCTAAHYKLNHLWTIPAIIIIVGNISTDPGPNKYFLLLFRLSDWISKTNRERLSFFKSKTKFCFNFLLDNYITQVRNLAKIIFNSRLFVFISALVISFNHGYGSDSRKNHSALTLAPACSMCCCPKQPRSSTEVSFELWALF